MDRLRLAVIGAGGTAALGHLPSHVNNPRVSVVGLADTNPTSAHELASRFGIRRVSADYREFLDDPQVDVFDVCVPPHLHAPISIEALEAGKHVICETPIALSLKEADAMQAAAAASGRRLMITMNQRFLPVNRLILKMIEAGDLGDVFLIQCQSTTDHADRLRDPCDWLSDPGRGGGALFESGVHCVDLLRWWLGEPSAAGGIMKRASTDVPGRAEDSAVVVLEWGSRAAASLAVSCIVTHEPASEKKFIFGRGGDLSLINEAYVPMFYVREGSPKLVEVEHRIDWWPWSMDLALTSLTGCILGEDEPPVSALDAREALRTVLSIRESNGGRVAAGGEI